MISYLFLSCWWLHRELKKILVQRKDKAWQRTWFYMYVEQFWLIRKLVLVAPNIDDDSSLLSSSSLCLSASTSSPTSSAVLQNSVTCSCWWFSGRKSGSRLPCPESRWEETLTFRRTYDPCFWHDDGDAYSGYCCCCLSSSSLWWLIGWETQAWTLCCNHNPHCHLRCHHRDDGEPLDLALVPVVVDILKGVVDDPNCCYGYCRRIFHRRITNAML